MHSFVVGCWSLVVDARRHLPHIGEFAVYEPIETTCIIIIGGYRLTYCLMIWFVE